jgi:hypothetical protein
MNLQNGYKVIYEKAVGGTRTFYASKSASYPNANDAELATFNDEEFRGKVVYEHNGKIYVSKGATPVFDENGEPTDEAMAEFDSVIIESDAAVNAPAYAPVQPEDATQFAYTDAISTNGDSHGKLTSTDNVVTLKATGKINPATNPNGNTYHHVGFKITAPEGINPANVVITRPDGKTRVMANILDGENFTNAYWKITEDERVFTYYIDWNNDGVNDLTIIIDASKATLVPVDTSAEA